MNDLPYEDVDSPQAALAAERNSKVRYRYICQKVARAPNRYSCWDFCEGFFKHVTHGSASGSISNLFASGFLIRTGRKKNGLGSNEYTYTLDQKVYAAWPRIDWNRPLKHIAAWLDLTPKQDMTKEA